MRRHDPPRNTHHPTPSTSSTLPPISPAHSLEQTLLERAVGSSPRLDAPPVALDVARVAERLTGVHSVSLPTPGLRLLLTIPEAAEALGMGRTFVYALVMQGELFSVKVGRTRRIPVKALLDYVERLTAQQAE